MPCSGGVYLAVLSLLSLQASALVGFASLVLYNLMFILPLGALLIAADARGERDGDGTPYSGGGVGRHSLSPGASPRPVSAAMPFQ